MNNIKNLIRGHLPHTLAHYYIFYRKFHYFPNYWNPKTYDEKIHWLILNIYDERYSKYADKLEVRSYIENECDFGNLLVPLYDSFNSTSDIDFALLPNQFMMMTNHGSGSMYYQSCFDKNTIDYQKLMDKMDVALKTKFWATHCEYHYKPISPIIMCLQLLTDNENEKLTDYKVLCSRGKPICILVCSNRDEGRDYYSTNWEYLDYSLPEFRCASPITKPTCLDEMLRAASIISKPFPFARIDFYEVKGKLYFSEITLTPSAGLHSNISKEAQIEIGNQIEL